MVAFWPHDKFTPTSTQPAIKCLKFIFLAYQEKKENIVCMMKQNHTKQVYSSFFNPLKVTGKLKLESLGRVHRGKLSGGKLAMGRNRYHSFTCRLYIHIHQLKIFILLLLVWNNLQGRPQHFIW